jgi:hypothetical protein
VKLLRLAVAAVFASAFGSAYAFHSGGVAECEGCHSMHNSLEGAANVTGMAQFASGPYLLKARDQSGACLNCHEASPGSYHISTPGTALNFSTATQGNYAGITQQTAGGDFAWLKSTRTYTVRGNVATAHGERQGHNILAQDFGFVQDSTQTVAPGGSYPAGNLHCSSCHDPHGKYRRFADGSVGTTGLPIFNSGSYVTSNAPIANVSAVGVYRLLAGVGYQPKSLTGSFAFTAPSPDAVSPGSYNSANATIAGVADRVAYGQGMSEWCANCHGALLRESYTSGMAGLTHPAGNQAKLTAAVAANYNNYVTSGVALATGATGAMNGYSALAPFETGMAGRTPADYAALVAFQAAPTAASTSNNVSCLSCHRAHASGFESMVRYQIGNEFMTIADASNAAAYDPSTTENKINFGYSAALQQVAYNGRPAALFGPYARNYCNKCHAKD